MQPHDHLPDWLSAAAALKQNKETINVQWQIPAIFDDQSSVPYPVQKYHIVTFDQISRSVELFDVSLDNELLK